MKITNPQSNTSISEIADGIYRINTAITSGGSEVDAGFWVDKRDRQTRRLRWEQLDEDLAYKPGDLDRDVVATDQLRTVLETFRDKVFTEMFPGRTDLPKTLIFAKDDTHADDIGPNCEVPAIRAGGAVELPLPSIWILALG